MPTWSIIGTRVWNSNLIFLLGFMGLAFWQKFWQNICIYSTWAQNNNLETYITRIRVHNTCTYVLSAHKKKSELENVKVFWTCLHSNLPQNNKNQSDSDVCCSEDAAAATNEEWTFTSFPSSRWGQTRQNKPPIRCLQLLPIPLFRGGGGGEWYASYIDYIIIINYVPPPPPHFDFWEGGAVMTKQANHMTPTFASSTLEGKGVVYLSKV